MNEINTAQIIKGFLADVAEVQWKVSDGDSARGSFPARLDSLYQIGLHPTELYIWAPKDDDDQNDRSIRFKIEENSLRWTHFYGPDYKLEWNDDPTICTKSNLIHLADPKFFSYFVQIICLNLMEPKVSDFILRRIINKPKFNAMCPENLMRHCRRHAKYIMSCEAISEFIWKS